MAADRSSPPHINPASRGCRQDFAASESVEDGVSVQTTTILVLPFLDGGSCRPIRSLNLTTSSGPADLGRTIPSGAAGMIASTSSRHHAVSSELIRTYRRGPALAPASVSTT